MKSLGIVRKLDQLGRIVIPMEWRRNMGIEEGTPLEMFSEGDRLVIGKYKAGCSICDSVDGVFTEHYGKLICHRCVDEMAAKKVNHNV